MKKIMVLIIILGIFLSPELYGEKITLIIQETSLDNIGPSDIVEHPALCLEQTVTIWGTAGPDIIEGTAGPDVIHGLAGNDVIYGKGGDDVICGGDGSDFLDGGPGDDILLGEISHDHLWGGPGDDILYGGPDHDVLNGREGNDKLFGDEGNDTLIGFTGFDKHDGGPGNDTCKDGVGALIANCEGSNFAAVSWTWQTKSFASGDYGDLQMGVKWPDPRFVDNGDGTVTDRLTRLIWLRKTNCFGRKFWSVALFVSKNLTDGQCGLSDGSSPGDWRLPILSEIQSLVDYRRLKPALPFGHPFSGAQSCYYWSSTTVANYTHYAFVVSLYAGHVDYIYKDLDAISVWPVRDGN